MELHVALISEITRIAGRRLRDFLARKAQCAATGYATKTNEKLRGLGAGGTGKEDNDAGWRAVEEIMMTG